MARKRSPENQAKHEARNARSVATLPDAPVTTGRRADKSLVIVEFAGGALTYPGLTDKGLELATAYAAKGYTHTAFAAAVGISNKGWAAIRERQPAALEAWEEGLAKHDSRLKDGLNKHVEADNLIAILAALKMVHNYRDSGPTNPNVGTGPTINITFNQPSSLQDVTAMIGEMPPLPDEEPSA